jgi:hypothetical protein
LGAKLVLTSTLRYDSAQRTKIIIISIKAYNTHGDIPF